MLWSSASSFQRWAYAWNNAKRIHVIERDSVRTPGAHVYEIEGPLFFGSTAGFGQLFHPETDPEIVIVDFHAPASSINPRCKPLKTSPRAMKPKARPFACATSAEIATNCSKRAGQLMVDQEDDPDYEVAVDYGVRTGVFGAGN